MERIFEQIVVIATAIIGVAILAVLVSRQANTAGVITAASRGFATALGAATAPVTGQSFGTFGQSPGYNGFGNF
jgi:hypothetical protein